ncbi:hypothetical protein ABNavy1_183 [Acinetobacter phage AB-Navy1]|nr:hypothetical protein ABNavy1_183 [Acinetobacter phage AB-Navy1]
MKYCTYMTVYYGDLMPRRYIGSSSIDRILSGYKGSVKSAKWKTIWRNEIKNRPHLFKTRVLSVFDSRDEALNAELRLHIKYDVVKSEKYINMAIAQPNGFFGMSKSGTNLTSSHKRKISQSLAGKKRGKYKPMSALGREHISRATSGKNNPMYGKVHPKKGKSIHQPRACCVFCQTESSVGAITRYHKNCGINKLISIGTTL